MARPKKKGLDYFPVDTDIFQDVKIRRLIRRHKQAGFLLYMQLLCDIYRHSFYIQLADDYCFDLAEQWNLTERGVKTMIRSMIEFGLFYNNLHRKDILTSCSIQERYFMVKGKNINLEDSEKELLLTSICTEKPGVLDAKSTQRKEKERKENNMSERVRVRTQAMEQWEAWNQELLSDEAWRYSVVQQAGLGVGFDSQIPEKLSAFNQFLVSTAETDSVPTLKDYQRRFHYWLRDYGAKRPKMGKNEVSRIEELNRVGEESLAMARQIWLNGECA